MATDNTKQNPIDEVEPVNEPELSEETLEGINGGIATGPYGELRPRPRPKSDEPKDGGATGSW